jgi:hypothetical protein
VKLPGRGRIAVKALLRRVYVEQDNQGAFDSAAQLGFTASSLCSRSRNGDERSLTIDGRCL